MTTAKIPADLVQQYSPIHNRIGPIFDPAWLKLVDEGILREIISIQLDSVAEQLAIEQKAVANIKNIVNKRRG